MEKKKQIPVKEGEQNVSEPKLSSLQSHGKSVHLLPRTRNPEPEQQITVTFA